MILFRRIPFFVFSSLFLVSCTKNITVNKPISIDQKDYSYCELKLLQVSYQPDADKYYPSFSKRSGEQGDVVTRIYINQLGKADEVRLLQSSSFPRLDRAAIEISRRYEFRPFMKDSKPINCYTNMLVKFRLKISDINEK